MKLLEDKVVGEYLVPYLNNKWQSMHQEATQYPDRRFPFIVEEAVLNTALTGSIFKYLHDIGDYSSTLVSEAQVKRYGSKGGKCDIIWYCGESVYYVELKGVFLFDTAEASIKELLECLKKAIDQVLSITSYSIEDKKVTMNEDLYGFTPKYRYGFVGGLLLSDKKYGEFSDYLDYINSNRLYIDAGQKEIELKHYERQFEGCLLNASYFDSRGQKTTIEADGYFFLCAEFEV